MKIVKEARLLWLFLKRYRTKVYFIIFVALISSLISAVIPYIYGHLVDIALAGAGNILLVFQILGFWLFLTLLLNWFNRFIDTGGSLMGEKISNDLKASVTNHLLSSSIHHHVEKKMGEIIKKIEEGSNYLNWVVESVVFTTFPSLMTVTAILIFMFIKEWRLFLLLLIILVFYVLATVWKTEPIIKATESLNRAREKSYEHLYDCVANIKNIKSNANENFERRRNKENFERSFLKFKSFMKAWRELGAWQQTVFGIGFVLIFGTAVIFLEKNIISTGELIMFIGYVNMVYDPFKLIGENYRLLKRGMASVKRVLQIFNIGTEDYKKGGTVILKNIKGKVEFKNVSFGYQKHKRVLDGISFTANPGETIAIVGRSGTGKTTLIDLISRYYKVASGKILIDGYDIQNIDLKSLRSIMAVVPQEVTLFNDSIKDNILYGNLKAGEEEMMKASKIAKADEFIQNLPKKYNQAVGESDINLSTGQKQRIAIARALIRDPKILMLDEAMTSIDSEAEKMDQEAVRRVIKSKATTFIIAHRLSTIMNADKILVLDKGKIAEMGNHQELIGKNGLYKKMFTDQLSLLSGGHIEKVQLTAVKPPEDMAASPKEEKAVLTGQNKDKPADKTLPNIKPQDSDLETKASSDKIISSAISDAEEIKKEEKGIIISESKEKKEIVSGELPSDLPRENKDENKTAAKIIDHKSQAADKESSDVHKPGASVPVAIFNKNTNEKIG